LAEWGLPVDLGDSNEPRWLAVDVGDEQSIPVRANGGHLIFAFCCGAAASGDPNVRDALEAEIANSGQEVGVLDAMGPGGVVASQTLRRRVEIGPPGPRWFLPFGAVGHRPDRVLGESTPIAFADWPLHAIGVEQGMFREPASLWLWAWPLPESAREVREIRIRSTGATICVGAVGTLEEWTHPFKFERIDLLLPERAPTLAVERGWLLSYEPLAELPEVAPHLPAFIGFGGGPKGPTYVARLLVNPEGAVQVNGAKARVTVLRSAGHVGSIRVLRPLAFRTRLRVTHEGHLVPCRISIRAEDGRLLVPLDYPRNVHETTFFDSGTSVVVGGELYSYGSGEFEFDAPEGRVSVEIWHGPQFAPSQSWITVSGVSSDHELALDRAFDWSAEGWTSADTHVHFLGEGAADVHAAAEGLDQIHLLALRWGEISTAIRDGPGLENFPRARVQFGREHRHHRLGHLSALGVTPPLPLSTGGPGEGNLGETTSATLTDWARSARELGGLAILAHWPDPYLESVAAVLCGAIDAVELWFSDGQPSGFLPASDISLDNFRVREWYRFLNLGLRLPIVGGTDKMSAGTVAGSLRTWAYTAELAADGWAPAVRAGRTVVSSGPLLELWIDEAPIGSVVAGDRMAECRWRVRSVLPVDYVELIVNGEVRHRAPVNRKSLESAGRLPLQLPGGGWVAARCAGSDLIEQWQPMVPIAAHTSPIYLDGSPPVREGEVPRLRHLLDGARVWSSTLAHWDDDDVRSRFEASIESAMQSLELIASRA
jgi:hypothetical protein